MKIEPGYYRTRNGSRARVLCTDAPGDYPVVGHDDDSSRVTLFSWTQDGRFDVCGESSGWDLIEPWREPVRVSGWVRLYPNGMTSGIWDTEEEALDSMTAQVKAVYVTGTEGIGPEGTGVGPTEGGEG